jgi:hypothetical protein
MAVSEWFVLGEQLVFEFLHCVRYLLLESVTWYLGIRPESIEESECCADILICLLFVSCAVQVDMLL